MCVAIREAALKISIETPLDKFSPVLVGALSRIDGRLMSRQCVT